MRESEWWTWQQGDREATQGATLSWEVWGCSISQYHFFCRTSGLFSCSSTHHFLTTTIFLPLSVLSLGAKHLVFNIERYRLTQTDLLLLPVLFYAMTPYLSGWQQRMFAIISNKSLNHNLDKDSHCTVLHRNKEFVCGLFALCLELLVPFPCLLLGLSLVSVFTGEAVCIMQGPSSATHHQCSSGKPVSRIPQPDVHRERWVAWGHASAGTNMHHCFHAHTGNFTLHSTVAWTESQHLMLVQRVCIKNRYI